MVKSSAQNCESAYPSSSRYWLAMFQQNIFTAFCSAISAIYFQPFTKTDIRNRTENVTLVSPIPVNYWLKNEDKT